MPDFSPDINEHDLEDEPLCCEVCGEPFEGYECVECGLCPVCCAAEGCDRGDEY